MEDLNKRQMRIILEGIGVKPSLEGFEFPYLNCLEAYGHKFKDFKVEEIDYNKGKLFKITGKYEYKIEGIRETHSFEICRNKLKTRQIKC